MPTPYAVSSSRAVPAPIDEAFLHTLRLPLPEMFSRRYLAIPRIVRVDQLDPGPWGEVGQRRTIHLADGGSMLETLTRCDEPDAFGYDITGLRGALSPLASLIQGPTPSRRPAPAPASPGPGWSTRRTVSARP